jgi:DNA-binding CsgD family transcriptional regulator
VGWCQTSGDRLKLETELEHAGGKTGVVHELVDLVVGCQSVEELCTRLVHDEFTRGVIQGVHAYSVSSEMDLIYEIGYGRRSVSLLKKVSAWDDSLLAKSLRTKSPSFEIANEESRLALPLLVNRVPIACLVLILDDSIKNSPLSETSLQLLSKIAGLLVDSKPVRLKKDSERRNLQQDKQLAPRQVAILEFVANGLTNGQIGKEFSLSESTVRQETIKIYKFLDAQGRIEAVAKARVLGLIQN